MNEKKTWQQIPLGGKLVEAGNAAEYNTGSWRSQRPVHDAEKCNDCLRCFLMCPDSCIVVDGGKFIRITMEHCKGCGVCAFECPDKISAIKMVPERK